MLSGILILINICDLFSEVIKREKKENNTKKLPSLIITDRECED